MNLLLLAVWCGFLLSCTFSLPRKRQIKYPVTKFQNSHYERSHPTALEVLERTLLHPSDQKGKHSHLRSGRRSAKHYIGRPTPPLVPSNLELGEVSEKEDNIVDRCVASFGDQSPLCKPRRRHKKSFMGIPDIHKRLFRSNNELTKNMSISPRSPEDFFGIFETSNEPTISKDTFISKLNDSPKVLVSNSTVSNTSVKSEIQVKSNSPSSVTQPVMTTVQQKVTAVLVSSGVPLISAANKMILPGNVQKIESEPQNLYIEEIDGSEFGQSDSHLDTTVEPTHEDVTEELKHEGDTAIESGHEGDTAIESGHEVDTIVGSEHEVDTTVESHHEVDTAVNALTEVITIDPKHEGVASEQESTTHVTSLLSGEVYSKAKCEAEKKRHCVCSFSTVDSDFRTIFSRAKNEEEVMEQISHMKCRHYIPKQSSLDLSTNTKPRVLKGKHAPFAVDNHQGAKEVSEKSLDEYIAYSAVDDGIIRVFVSSNVKIPCFPKADIHLSASEADHVKYDWTFGDSKQTITQGRISEDSEGGGSLIIEDVELTDSMNYTCEIEYIHPDTGERTTDTFVHTLSVVSLPIVSARVMVHYTSHAACDESLLEVFEMYLPQQLEYALCSPDRDRQPLCRVVVHSPVCHSDKQERTKREAKECIRKKREQDSMEMSLNYDVFIHRPATKALPGEKAKWCDPDCHLLISFKLLQMLREGVEVVALTPISSNVQDAGTFTPVAGSVKVKYIFGCIGGYYLDNGFCLACPRGMYSDDGATECKQCPLHTFSSKLGTRTCTPCQYVWMPICNEYFASINVKIIIIVLLGVVLVVALFVCYYVFYYKGQTWKEVMKKGPKEKIARSEKMKFKRETKRIKAEAKRAEKEARKVAKEEEIKRLLQSSGESESESEAEKRIQFSS